jgi:hypothetical protein
MKLESFKRFAQVDCPRDHVIKFNNKPESLTELVEKIKIERSERLSFDFKNLKENAKNVTLNISDMISGVD